MNVKDKNLRLALLKAMADAIAEEMAAERAEHTAMLRAQYDESGVKSFDVKLPGGGKVGTISLSIPKPSTAVVNTDAFVEWCRENLPTAVTATVIPAMPERTETIVIPATPERTVYTVDDKMTDALLKGARPVDPAGGMVVDEDGTVIDGVEYRPAGDPKSFSVRYEAGGRDALAVAYRGGELDHLVGGSILPALEVSHAIPMPSTADEMVANALEHLAAEPEVEHDEDCDSLKSGGDGINTPEMIPGDLDCNCPAGAATVLTWDFEPATWDGDQS